MLLLRHGDFGDPTTEGTYLFKHECFGVWPFPLPGALLLQDASARPSGGYERRFASQRQLENRVCAHHLCIHFFMNTI